MKQRPLPALVIAVAAFASSAGAAELSGALSPGQVHRHRIDVPAGGFVRVTLHKDGADLDVRLLDPAGAPVVEANTLMFPPGTVTFGHASPAARRYLLEVRMAVTLGTSRYEATIEHRSGAAADADAIAAERAYLRGERQRLDGSKEAFEQAGRELEQALALNTAHDAVLEANALTALARVRDIQGDKPAARALYDRAIAMHRASGRDSALAYTLSYLALVFDHLGDREAALDTLAEAAAAAERAGDRRSLGLVLNNTGLVVLNQGSNEEALFYYDEALLHHRAVANIRGEANTLNGVAAALDRLGQKRRGLAMMKEALPLREAAGDRRDLAAMLNNIGQIHATLDEVTEALPCFQRALQMWRAAGDRTGEAATLHNVASVHEGMGEYQQAIGLWKQTLPLFRATGAEGRAAVVLTNMGRLYVALGDSALGVPLLEQALVTHRATGNRSYESAALANLGTARALAGDLGGALALHEQALAIRRELKDPLNQAHSLRDLARTHAAMGAHGRALELLEEAVALHRSVGLRRGEALAQVDIAQSRLALGDAAGARQSAETALDTFRQLGHPRGEASALLAAARADVAEERFPSARARLEAAIGILEGLRAGLAAPELRASFLASVQDYYELLVQVLMELHGGQPGGGLDAAALAVAERAHARGLLDVLAEARLGIRQGADPALLDREAGLRRTLNAKAARQARLWAGKASDEETRTLAGEVAALTADLRALEAELRERSPRYAELVQPQPLDAAAIRSRVLDADTLLLEYALGRERSWVFLVTPAGVTARALPARAVIEERARAFYEAVRRPGGAAADAGRELAAAVLPPLDAAPGRLLIVPDGALHLVPMGALPLPDGRPLVTAYEVVTLSSASALDAVRQDAAGRTPAAGVVAVLADPVFEADDPRVRARRKHAAAARRSRALETDGEEAPGPPARLIGSRREADAILAHAPARATLRALDFEASRATATGGRLAGFRVVHFATHGIVDHVHPELSGIVLSLVDAAGKPQDGVLRLHDVYNLRLRADLVVLSACDTALGPNVRGEGLIGLTRGFLYAGARSVLASLWRVDDAATAELMRRFYDGLLGATRLTPAAALRAAQAGMARDPRWSDPFHWAGFVLQGDWR